MNSKVIRLFYAMLFVGFVLCLVAVLLNKDFSVARLIHDDVFILNESAVKTEEGDIITYKTKLPTGNNAGKTIAFYSSHFKSKIIINENEIYSYRSPYGNIFKSSGYKWNYVFLDQEYSDADIKIIFEKDFHDSFDEPNIFFGQYKLIVARVFEEEHIRFIISLIILFIGFVLLLYSIFVINEHVRDSTLIHFGIFAILLGFWCLSDSQISALVWNAPVVFMFMTHISLMIMPAAFIMFIHNTYQDRTNFHWGNFCNLSNIIALIRMFLQLRGIKDFKETLWMTHISIVALVVICIYMSIREIKLIKLTKQMWTNIITVLLIMFTTALDLIYYQIYHTSSSFGPVGFLLYILIMGIHTIKISRKMLERSREAEVYRKLAFTDELSGLFNRTAFHRDMENHDAIEDKTKRDKVSLIMLDLNDLKKCNDNYGHNYGDEYITMVSKTIHEVFGLDGRCYRIGGDEFCVMLPFASNNDLNNKVESFKIKISRLNTKNFVVPISVALGHATYNSSEDESLNDTLSRADKLMYENKILLKQAK